MIDFIMQNLEVLWLAGAAIIGDYVRLRVQLSKLANNFESNKEKLQALQQRSDEQARQISELATGFAQFNGTMQAEINKLLIGLHKSDN